MDPERFRDAIAGQLIRAGRGQAAYWAFVPHPLPPSLPLDLKLVSALSEADCALGELAGLGRTILNPHLLLGSFVRREAVLSSRIEGTQTEILDLYGCEAGQVPRRRRRSLLCGHAWADPRRDSALAATSRPFGRRHMRDHG